MIDERLKWSQSMLLVQNSSDQIHQLISTLALTLDETKPKITTKGAPNLSEYKRIACEEILSLTSRNYLSPHELCFLVERARRLAALDILDGRGFHIFLAVFSTVNRKTLEALRRYLKPFVVLHVSCVPRLERARASWTSFESIPLSQVAQITVVGRGSTGVFDFDERTGLLGVPEEDSYDQLPSKVTSALAFLGLTGEVRAVLKVDDDHRLLNSAMTLKLLERIGNVSRANMCGRINLSGGYGLHGRAWHFGKCPQSPINLEPYTFLGTLAWVTGEGGYIINKAGLNIIIWAFVYFHQQILIGLFEDITISDFITRLGGRIRPLDMDKLLFATTEY